MQAGKIEGKLPLHLNSGGNIFLTKRWLGFPSFFPQGRKERAHFRPYIGSGCLHLWLIRVKMYMSRYWSLFYRFALKRLGPYKRKVKTWPVSMSILNLGWIYIRHKVFIWSWQRMRYSATAETLVKACVIFVSLYGTKQSHDFTLYRQFSTNEKARLCFSKKKRKKNYKSKHRPSDQKFSQQRTRSDRISNRFEALRHILKTFHEAYTFFLSGQRIGSHIGSVSWNIQHILWLISSFKQRDV